MFLPYRKAFIFMCFRKKSQLNTKTSNKAGRNWAKSR